MGAIRSALFVLLVATVCQIAFSWMGFNPTDDGFTLAYSRRILDGQVPHRDFIIIRPALSPLLHVGEVYFGGEFTYWISRYVAWIQLAVIAWLWILCLDRLTAQKLTSFHKILLALLVFAVSSHTFPPMAWHTVDGVTFLTIGIFLIVAGRGPLPLAYLVLSLSYLCKQNFVFAPLLALLIFGHWRFLGCWIAAALPGAGYLGWLAIVGAWPDAVTQFTSQTDVFQCAVLTYVSSCRSTVAALLGGVLLAWGVEHVRNRASESGLGIARWSGVAVWAGVSIAVSAALFTGIRIFTVSFGLFGLLLGRILSRIYHQGLRGVSECRAELLVLMAGWVSSISIGYNTPVLLSGQMLAVLAGPWLGETGERFTRRSESRSVLTICTIAVLAAFIGGRTLHIYRDKSAFSLSAPLGDVLPGGKWIRTNTQTHAFLFDLNEIVQRVETAGKRYAIIPECAGWWAKSRQANPLPIDWAQATELKAGKLWQRVIAALERGRADQMVIVQKAKAESLVAEPEPVGADYAVAEHVRQHFQKRFETTWFEAYQ